MMSRYDPENGGIQRQRSDATLLSIKAAGPHHENDEIHANCVVYAQSLYLYLDHALSACVTFQGSQTLLEN